jgi:hypothetical protein
MSTWVGNVNSSNAATEEEEVITSFKLKKKKGEKGKV